uniref:Uncharacterized protein n=1 Tax=Romanomermis culicivorax TaxID=13658 RepID=A0A915J350_ROMCU
MVDGPCLHSLQYKKRTFPTPSPEYFKLNECPFTKLDKSTVKSSGFPVIVMTGDSAKGNDFLMEKAINTQ